MMILALILGFLLGAAAIVFILQNTAVVALTFFSFQFSTSLALVVLLSMLVGIVLVLILLLPSTIGSAWRMRRLEKQSHQLKVEADQHRLAAESAQARLAQNQAQAQSGVQDLPLV